MRCSYPYTARTNAEGGIEIRFTQFPGNVSVLERDSDNKAIHKTAYQLLMSIFDARMTEREPIPGGEELETEAGDAFVFVSWLVLAKLLLYREFREAEVSYNAFAKKVGVSPTSFKRLLDVRHESKERLIFSAFDALGIETDWDFNLVPIERSYPK